MKLTRKGKMTLAIALLLIMAAGAITIYLK
jgi:hypothetical protein